MGGGHLAVLIDVLVVQLYTPFVRLTHAAPQAPPVRIYYMDFQALVTRLLLQLAPALALHYCTTYQAPNALASKSALHLSWPTTWLARSETGQRIG